MKQLATMPEVLNGLAEEFKDKPAFVCQGKETGFAKFNRRVNQLCHGLAGLGLAKGDRVAVFSLNRTEYVEAYCVGKSGLVGMPLNWRLAHGELVTLLRNAEAAAIIADAEHAPVVEEMKDDLPGLRHFIHLDGPRPGWLDYEDLLAEASDREPEAEVAGDDPLCLFFTSGTTGQPKGVVLTHHGLLSNSHDGASLQLGLTPDDKALEVMPLFHVGGMWYHLFANFITGCTTIIEKAFEPARTLDSLRQNHVTNIHLVPTMIGALTNVPGVDDDPPRDLRLMFYAGSSMPVDILRRAMDVFTHSEFVQSYGSTEGGICTTLKPGDHLEALAVPGREPLLQSCGKPMGDVRVKLLGPDGKQVEQGEIGEVTVKGCKTMQGYWRNPEADAATMNDGWICLGDLGVLDQDGYLYIVGRKHDMIVTGGENVFPHEVENALYAHPKVREAAVFGVPDPKWVEAVAAAVVLKDGCQAEADEIIAACRERLAGYKCPKRIFFTDDFPKNPAGKILKRRLREMYGG